MTSGPPNPPRPPRGRRPGPSTTRTDILAAALAAFAERGYGGTSVRGVAAAAGVDPALVHRYFGSKDGLFVAALGSAMNPGERIPDVMEGEPGSLGERVVRYFLSVWEASPGGEAMAALLRSAATGEHAAAVMRDFFSREVLGRIAAPLAGEDAQLRATLVSSQLVGLALARYIVRFEPLASLPAEEVVAAFAPTIQRYLTGPLAPAGAAHEIE